MESLLVLQGSVYWRKGQSMKYILCASFELPLDKMQDVIITDTTTYYNQLCVCCWQLAKDHGIRFFETSAKSSINVEEVSRKINTD